MLAWSRDRKNDKILLRGVGSDSEHVTKVEESEEIMGHKMHDFLVDFFAERNFQESTESVAAATTHKEWKIRSVSCKKNTIPSINNTKKSILSGRCSLWQNVNY